jgi:hypothetical protein
MAFSLFNLLDDFLVSLLVEWLYIEDLAHLDSAIFNHKIRLLFLGLLFSEHPGTSSVASTDLGMNSGVLQWLESRRIFLLHLKFRGDGLNTVVVPSPFLPTTGGKVQSLSCYKITNAGLESIAEGCPSLQSLRLNYCYSITDTGLRSITESCSTLQSFVISYCDGITDAGLRSIAEGCSTLQSLDFGGCDSITDAGLESIAEGCPRLQSLEISAYDSITDGAVQMILKSYPNLEIHRE